MKKPIFLSTLVATLSIASAPLALAHGHDDYHHDHDHYHDHYSDGDATADLSATTMLLYSQTLTALTDDHNDEYDRQLVAAAAPDALNYFATGEATLLLEQAREMIERASNRTFESESQAAAAIYLLNERLQGR